MALVAVTRAIPGTALDRLAAEHDVKVWPGSEPPTPAELAELVMPAAGVLSMVTDRLDAATLDRAAGLRAIANYGIGFDNIDLTAAAARGVPVGVTPDVLTDATADLAMALLLSVARHLPASSAAVRAGSWRAAIDPTGWLGLELRGATLLIVGPGRIGRATAERAEAFGMQVTFAGRDDDLHALLGDADVVSLHAPLTPQTRHVVDEAALAAMKPGALLINTGRGGLVDQSALRAALRSGHLGGAGLDVTDPEPLAAGDPLLDAPNLLVTPHIGSATHAARAAMADLAVDNLLAALAGRPMPHPAPTRARGEP